MTSSIKQPKDIPTAQLKNGDIVEIGGVAYIVRVRGINRDLITSVGLGREISIQSYEGGGDWSVQPETGVVRWIGQYNGPILDPWQPPKVEQKQSTEKNPRWQFWR